MYYYRRNWIILFLFFYSNFFLEAQEFTYFNKTFVGDTINSFALSVEQIGNDYLMFGLYTSTNKKAMYVRKINEYGKEIYFKDLLNRKNGSGGIVSGRNTIVTNDQNILLCFGYQEYLDSLWHIHFMKINQEGNIIWHTIHKNNLINGAEQVIQTYDKGFALVGIQRTSMQEPGVGYFLKTDSLANIEWEKTYFFDGHTVIQSIEQTHDNGFIISGTGYQIDTEFDMFVLKIDSLGKEEWRKTYGGEENERYSYIKLLTSKNQYEQTGNMEYLLIGEDEPKQSDEDLYIAQLDDRGIVLWENRYDDFAGLNYPYPVFETMPILKNGGFKIIANYQDRNEEGTLVHIPVLMDFKKYGQVNWQKVMSIDTAASVYMRDLQPTLDGGYIMAGFKFSPAPQQSWIVKVDADGNTCWVADCDSTVVFTDIPEFEQKNIRFSIAPNPASSQINITYQIPREGVLKVYDYQGRLIDNRILDNGYSSLTLKVSDWASGVYLYSLEIGGERLESGKLIVE